MTLNKLNKEPVTTIFKISIEIIRWFTVIVVLISSVSFFIYSVIGGALGIFSIALLIPYFQNKLFKMRIFHKVKKYKNFIIIPLFLLTFTTATVVFSSEIPPEERAKAEQRSIEREQAKKEKQNQKNIEIENKKRIETEERLKKEEEAKKAEEAIKIQEEKAKVDKDIADEKIRIAEEEKRIKEESDKKIENDRIEAENKAKAVADATRLAELNKPKPLPEYKIVKRDADELKGNKYIFTGKVLENRIENGLSVARVNVNLLDSYSDEILLILYDGKLDFFEDDIVEISGEMTGQFTYKSQANFTITVPSIKALSYRKI
jgi:hypothetical protein